MQIEIGAHSKLDIKSITESNGKHRTFRGIASTPTTDRMGDIVEPRGAEFSLPIPFLWQHDSKQPIGWITKATVADEGIAVEGEVLDTPEPGKLKERIDESWQMLKAKLVRGLSIGFQILESSDIKGTFGQRISRWSWLELSAVTIPANAEASITTIKSIDQQQIRAASGAAVVVTLAAKSPGASGSPSKTIPKGTQVKTTAERITEYEAKRAANAGRMTAIMEKSNEEGSTLDTEQTEEYDTLTAEVKAIDEHIGRLKMLETVQIAKALPITTAAGTTPAAQTHAVISVKNNLPKGTGFVRFAQALAFAKGNLMQAHEVAKSRWSDTPEVETVLKAAMTAGTTTGTTWAEPLVEYQTMAGEFIDLLRPETIVGRIQGLRRVPFNIRVAGKTQGSTVGWVGQGLAKPVSELAFNEVTLGLAKAAGIVVISQELARTSSPAAEGLIRQDLIDTISVFMDQQFIDPAVAAVANVSPASVTNGVTAVQATGTTIAQITADVTSLFNSFISANLSPRSAVWIMHPTTALALSLKRTTQDVFAFPSITLNGGTFFGLPVITSRSVPKTTSGGSIIVLMDAAEIFFADDGEVMLDVSEQASLQMNSTPSAGAQQLVSLWQNNLIGIRAERYMNWQRRRNEAVTYLDNVPAY